MRLDLIGKRHPLSITNFDTPDNQSSSSQSTSATTTNQDVANGGSGVAIGAGASYVNEFSPDVASAVNNAIDKVFSFGGNVVNALTATSDSAITGSIAAAGAAQQIANQAVNNTQLGQSSLFTNPAVIFGIVAVVGIFAFIIIKKK